jgi:hypothetical protein
MTQNLMGNAEHWRGCAAQARIQAATMETEERRRIMLRIASDYDALAENALKHAQGAANGDTDNNAMSARA